MSFTIEYSEKAIGDLQKHKKSGQKLLLKKIESLVKECIIEPREGS